MNTTTDDTPILSPSDSKRFIPKSVLCLKQYSRSLFLSDLMSGITVGIVALPLALAFAIASGVPPQSGIYCAIIAGFLISALGGSRTQIGGPTGAFVVVVASIVEKYGLDGLFTCTFLAGLMPIALGLSGLGGAVRFIPRPVTIGFTNGIAVLIASTQIKDYFGLRMSSNPGDFLLRMDALYQNFNTLSPASTALSTFALLLIAVSIQKKSKVPGSVIAILVCTPLAMMLYLPVETIQTRFGGIPQGLPDFHLPSLRPDLALKLLSPAITVAMLGAIESLLSAVVADGMSKDKHNPNVELFAQGVANVISPLAGGLPATGAIARTAMNIRSGAKTPVSGMIHALTLLFILLVAAPLAAQIPLPVLSAILLVVAYNMGEWREIPDILRLGKSSASVWLITFALTVFADLTVAVEAGLFLAALLYIRNVTETTTVAAVTPMYVESGFNHSLQHHPIPEGVAVFRIHGPFLFGATEKLSAIEASIPALPEVVVLRLRNMTAIDATGLHALEELAEKLKASGRHLLLCGARNQPEEMMRRAYFQEIIGEANILTSLAAAIERSKELLSPVQPQP